MTQALVNSIKCFFGFHDPWHLLCEDEEKFIERTIICSECGKTDYIWRKDNGRAIF